MRRARFACSADCSSSSRCRLNVWSSFSRCVITSWRSVLKSSIDLIHASPLAAMVDKDDARARRSFLGSPLAADALLDLDAMAVYIPGGASVRFGNCCIERPRLPSPPAAQLQRHVFSFFVFFRFFGCFCTADDDADCTDSRTVSGP